MSDARTLTKSLGGMWCGSYGLVRCPVHDDRKPSLKIKDDDRKGDGIDLHCFAGCDWQIVKDTLRQSGYLDPFVPGETSLPRPKPILVEDDTEKIRLALAKWHKAVPLSGTLGWKYLTEHRQLDIAGLGNLDHCLRWSEPLKAVLGLMTNPTTGEPRGVQRIYLSPRDGTKRGDPRMSGKWGVVRLSRDEEVETRLGIAEGIEKSLRVLLSGWTPVWCATCSGGIGRFPVLNGIEALTIFADDGEAGVKGAEECVARWRKAGRKCLSLYPKDYR